MEKTFEELMHEYTVKMDGVTTYYLQPKTVLALLQQVREATIAECAEVAREHWTSPEIHINQLPTNSIKTDL